MLIGRSDAESEYSDTLPNNAKSQLIGSDPDKTLQLEWLKTKGEEGDRGWDSWVTNTALLIQN